MGKEIETESYILAPDPDAVRLTRGVTGRDQNGVVTEINVVEERPLTIFLNAREIVTAMTIGDYPEYLALGFLRNQGMITDADKVLGVEYDEESEAVVVRTDQRTRLRTSLRKRHAPLAALWGLFSGT